ncbi:unnamed protein product [Rhizophagus irregularis]|uniref:Uncharacterized protein n=1 Tax=Rhizophagus irregularis TaxID=588596 RepID=A0A915ZNL4_9GLOM|nr:unnamed protein product [Rhizophagus irregularis]CAB5384742.1 unnamed protein product [Rhizophagus irregularis]
MNKPAKPDKEKMNGINKIKLMNNENKKLMCISILIVVIVLFMTIFVQDEAKWNSPNLLRKPHELPHNPVHNPVVEQFTSDLFRDISLAEIPALDEIIQHVYSYNELATMLEMSPAHKNTRKIAAERLRDVSILLYEARDALHKMFVESKTVYYTFEIEVKAIIEKFTGIFRIFVKPNFFKIRILKLEKAIMEFRIIVNNAMQLIIEVQQKTKEISKSLLKAQVEARDYNIDNDTGKRNFDLTTEAIDGIRNVRGYLNGTALSLRVIHNKLKDYQLNINKVKINLGAAEYEITNESLQHLKAAVDLWRYSLKRSVLLMVKFESYI